MVCVHACSLYPFLTPSLVTLPFSPSHTTLARHKLRWLTLLCNCLQATEHDRQETWHLILTSYFNASFTSKEPLSAAWQSHYISLLSSTLQDNYFTPPPLFYKPLPPPLFSQSLLTCLSTSFSLPPSIPPGLCSKASHQSSSLITPHEGAHHPHNHHLFLTLNLTSFFFIVLFTTDILFTG